MNLSAADFRVGVCAIDDIVCCNIVCCNIIQKTVLVDSSFAMASLIFLVLIALERLFAVLSPLRQRGTKTSSERTSISYQQIGCYRKCFFWLHIHFFFHFSDQPFSTACVFIAFTKYRLDNCLRCLFSNIHLFRGRSSGVAAASTYAGQEPCKNSFHRYQLVSDDLVSTCSYQCLPLHRVLHSAEWCQEGRSVSYWTDFSFGIQTRLSTR